MKTMNDQRAERFGEVLRRYGAFTNNEVCLRAFLADARHWCDQNEVCFAMLDRRAFQHYLTELFDNDGGSL